MKWEKVKLGEVCFIQGGYAFKSTEYLDSGIPLIRISNIYGDKIQTQENTVFVDKEYLNTKNNFVIKKGDVLIALSGATTGKYGVFDHDFPALLNQRVGRVVANTKLTDSAFIYYYLGIITSRILKNAYGAAIPNISPKNISNFQIPLPPLAEQKRIAAILDKADSLRQLRRESIAQCDEFLRSVFLDMFGDPVVNPKGWEVKKLGILLKFMTSGSRGWAKYYSETGDIFLRIQNVGKNRLIFNDLTHVIAPGTAESKRTKVQTGDILLSITADLGRTAVIPDNLGTAYINQHLALLRLNDSIAPIFVSEFLSSHGGKQQIITANKGGTKAGLNFNDIKNFCIPIPPLPLQEKFALVVQKTAEQKARMEAQLAEAEQLFGSLMQRAFRGDL
jgi:type I restriction enzyme, S subunit